MKQTHEDIGMTSDAALWTTLLALAREIRDLKLLLYSGDSLGLLFVRIAEIEHSLNIALTFLQSEMDKKA